jgi:hypothetical protein
MKIFGICLFVVALAAPGFGNDKKAKVDEDPVVFGMIGQNLGCVIFKEYRKTNTQFWGVAVTQKTFSGIEVIETFPRIWPDLI